MHAKPGDRVRAGDRLATLYTDTPERFEYAQQALESSWEIGATASQPRPLVIDRVGQ
ncbi:MAG: hypothetical protein WBG53_02580 [Rhodococcus sp. (in: high G+C Gram-positive bacteria)]